jgi:hypothetical protein
MPFDAAIEAKLSGQTVTAACLFHFDWLSSTSRFWGGSRLLRDGNGDIWKPTNGVISCSPLSRPGGSEISELTVRLSGVDPDLVALALDASDEVVNRPLRIFWQFFNSDWSLLDLPVAVGFYLMDTIKVIGSGPENTVALEVTAFNLLTNRGKPAWGWWTDRDQQKRVPGDRGFEYVSQMATETPLWPDFEEEP